ncbi:hypothetical protein HU200_066408 [Digitaria exilis]|uniref:Uncharacterized protein n=1 Tax=Digitaria exilis TaxID=1010633 RepID=A0A835DSV3_9POAL|nr:hypothetical protein HU200_066408 [Digitaria exilis]
MQSIRRELQRRRPKPLAPKSSTTKKTSAPLRLSPPLEGAHQEHSSSSAASKSPRPRPPHPSSRAAAVHRSSGSACPSTNGSDERLRPGTAVGVRTKTTKLKTGKVLVLWLRATIVSPTHHGYEVIYDGSWPPSDPYGTVHVPRRHVRMIKPSSSPTTSPPQQTPPSRAPSSSASDDATATAKKKEMGPAPRPTTAGKSVHLVRSLFPELERQARAALPYY